ncbi:MAG: [FeFe] hydrogenase, group A [Candidatus Pacebacteria bacterium]|nr:[FeFe] hydrogenase, group A [Candidatus Paceibacterota bacterium]
MVNIEIDGKKIIADEKKSILEIAKENNIDIPSLCYHSDTHPREGCRLCLIEIEGRKGLFTSCGTCAEEGMVIRTNTEEILKTRKTNLKLLFSQHTEKCGECIWNNRCKMLNYAKEWSLHINEWEDRKKDYPKHNFGPAIIYDSSKCINCYNCAEICKNQGIGYLEVKKENGFHKIVPTNNKDIDCVYCGQCLAHCPSGTFSSNDPSSKIEEEIRNNKYVVFEFAPSIRTSIGEEFDMAYGTVVIEKMIAGIKKLGAKKVFDVSLGADLVTIEEANELIERLEKKEGLPMFTSCCPAWVKFVEFYKPEFIPNLTTVKSPQILLGGVIKTYFAEKENIDPKNIVVVSVMPCTSKKYECERGELKINGLKCVDYVLTTHELARMFLKHDIDLKEIEGEDKDNLLGLSSGAGVIFGASGGVAESATRTACYKLLNKKLDRIDFKEFRGQEGIKEAVVKIGEAEIRIAVVNGLMNARKIIENHLNEFDYIEVMSCPGGCIGGGGQPVPVDKDIRQKRADSLYQIDEKEDIRIADENPLVQNIYKEFLINKEIINKIAYTTFSKKQKEN